MKGAFLIYGWNLTGTSMNNGWMSAPVHRAIGQYERSLKKYPNIKPGEEFQDYKAQ